MLVLVAILAGCSSLPPDYLVKLTPQYAGGKGSCTGMLLYPDVVLTAGHCTELKRVVTWGGDEAYVVDRVESGITDMALLVLDREIHTVYRPEFGDVDHEKPARFYGLCPMQWGASPRWGWHVERVRYPYEDSGPYVDNWQMSEGFRLSNMICGGDSGGLVMQENKIVGILSGIYVWFPYQQSGDEVVTIPTQYVDEMVERLKETE